MKKITWQVEGGNPAHEVPSGATVMFESEKYQVLIGFDETGEIFTTRIEKTLLTD